MISSASSPPIPFCTSSARKLWPLATATIFSSVAAFSAAIGLLDVGDVLRDDAYAEGGERILAARRVAQRVVARAGLDEGKGGDLLTFGREVRSRLHRLLDLAGIKADAAVDRGVAGGEVGDLDGHLAVDIGAVDLVVGVGSRRGPAGRVGRAVVGEDAERVVGRDLVGDVGIGRPARR